MSDLGDRAAAYFRDLQERITAGLEALDGIGRFREDAWDREGGGGGKSRVLADGRLFEKAGVNWSDVTGELAEDFAAQIPGEGRVFRATGVSLVLHPRTPMVPAVHANFRFLEKGDTAWFGGGADLTPTYPFLDDVVHFHRAWREVCEAHEPGAYVRFKTWCDEYFYLPHRDETRGVGGIFFDHLPSTDPGDTRLEQTFAFVRAAGDRFLDAYVPIADKRQHEPYGDHERWFQLYRRGRYVEFNLLYDRGTTFGLKTRGRTESILMSLPPLVRWEYDYQPPPGSREAELAPFLKPTDWLGDTTGSG